jgi:hypothetical protein
MSLRIPRELEQHREDRGLERVVEAGERRRPVLLERGDDHVHRRLVGGLERSAEAPPALEDERELRAAAHAAPPAVVVCPVRPPR